MNLRVIITELFQKPAGRLLLFLVAGALVLAFVFSGRGSRSAEPVNPTVPTQATAAKGYTFEENIPAAPPTRIQQPTPPSAAQAAKPTPTPKAPPPIPQAIFATKEAGHLIDSVGNFFLYLDQQRAAFLVINPEHF